MILKQENKAYFPWLKDQFPLLPLLQESLVMEKIIPSQKMSPFPVHSVIFVNSLDRVGVFIIFSSTIPSPLSVQYEI